MFLGVCGRQSVDNRRGKEDEKKYEKKRLEEYLNRKRLVLSVNKKKVMRFTRGGGKIMKTNWRRKGKKIGK